LKTAADVPRRVTSPSDEFTAVTTDEVAKLISCVPNKTCQLDPVPTWLVKDMSELLSPFIALLVNKSLTTGFAAEFKEAIIRPLLKRDGLDLSDLKTGQFLTYHSSLNCWRGWFKLAFWHT